MSEPYRPRYTFRMGLSDVLRGALMPSVVNVADRFTGNNVRNWFDDRTRAGQDRTQNEYNRYMQGLLRDDPGYQSESQFRNPFAGMFNRSQPGQQIPAWMQPGAPIPQQENPTWNPAFSWDQPQQPNEMYGRGQGMMRPPAPSVDRGGAVLARGEAAVDFARGLAQSQSGLNATSGGNRLLNQRARGFMR